jgi:outer membrane protein assembly factor BamB
MKRLLLIAVLLSICNVSQATDWYQFRGPNGASFHPDAQPPVEFDSASMKNIAWKADMPGRSVAGAIVVNDKVISTSSSGIEGQRIFVTANDLATGKRLWQQDMVCRGRPFSHPTSANSAPTPATDGERIFSFFSSNDLLCVDLDGNLVWYRSLTSDYPKLSNDVGMSSSPVVVSGALIVQAETPSESYLFGIDALTGTTLWKQNRPRSMNWTSPIAMQVDSDRPWVLATCGSNAVGLDPRTGNELFKIDGEISTIPSVAGIGDRFLVPMEGLTAFQIGSPGSAPIELWQSNKLGPGNASPIVAGNKVWVVRGSVLTQGSLETGDQDWQLRLPEAGGIWSTPVLCRDRVYIFCDGGKVFVVGLGDDKGELLSTNQIEDSVYGSPAVAGNSLIVRGDKYLWKIGN